MIHINLNPIKRKIRNNREKIRSYARASFYTAATVAGFAVLYNVPYTRECINYAADFAKYSFNTFTQKEPYTVKKNDTLDKILRERGVPKNEIRAAREAVKFINYHINGFGFNVDKIRAGDRIDVIKPLKKCGE